VKEGGRGGKGESGKGRGRREQVDAASIVESWSASRERIAKERRERRGFWVWGNHSRQVIFPL